MRKAQIIGLLAITVLLILAIAGSSFALSPAFKATAAPEATNEVHVDFSTRYIYEVPGDALTNGEVTGSKAWRADIGSGVPLTGLTLTLDSTLNFDHFQKENLTTTGPPTYAWSFGDVPPGTNNETYLGFESLDSPGVAPVTFTPGFDASRSVDKTEFSAPGTQTLTIVVTPREGPERLGIVIHADENDLVNPLITSPTSGDGIELKREGHSLHIDPTGLALNTTWTITVIIEVTPKVAKVEYMPYVGIEWEETLASGTASGNFLSFPVTDMGTWTWRAEGSYEWNWTDKLVRAVGWRPHPGGIEKDSTPVAPVEGNQVSVGFGQEVAQKVSGDTFTNSEVTGDRAWRITAISNTDDETGAPVKDLRVTLNSELAFDEVKKDALTKMGPPVYEWSYGDLVEESQHKEWVIDAIVGFVNYKSTVTPGLDASRSFDKTLFTAPDTQTLTITVTPREEWLEKVTINVHADENNYVDPVIISYSPTGAENIKLTSDRHHLGMEFIPVKLNTPLTITVTLRVTPKVPWLSYKPYVSVIPMRAGEADEGTTSGSSFSYTMPGVGTWTVSAKGNYVWDWSEPHGVGGVVVFSEIVVSYLPYLIAVVAGVVITGSVTYFFIRRRKRRVV